jgi:alpha-L-fucosidase 2
MKTSRRDTLKLLGMAMAAHSIPEPLFSAVNNVNNQLPLSGTVSSAFNPTDGTWNITWPGRISQYDLVYESPPIDPFQGMPLGNGDIGVLIWCEESKIIIAVNKCDLWEDAGFDRFGNWSKEQEDISTTLRHACRMVIDFKFPVFSTLYLSGFTGRLNIAEATVYIESESPFGKLSFEGFVDYASGIFFYSLKTAFTEDSAVDIMVERFGSRTYSHWYSQINGDAAIGTSGTNAQADTGHVSITQQLNDRVFTVAASIIQKIDIDVRYKREHARRALISLEKNIKKEVHGVVMVTSPQPQGAITTVAQMLQGLDGESFSSRREIHNAAWKAVWSKSFMDYGDGYINQLWHLTIYYAITSQGGKYPGRFTNGLWAWNHDVQNWNFYFHWNQQQLYWPLNAAGYHELVAPYLDYRFNSLPHAREDAQQLFHTKGAFIADVTERRGYNSLNESHNHTPVAEIALDFWRQYQYTSDKKFLREKALPFITDAALFFQSLFVKEADGLYHATEGTGYEGWIKLKDGLTEIVYARALFATALKAQEAAGVHSAEAQTWKDILENLAPLPVVQLQQDAIQQQGASYKLERGYFKGWEVETDWIAAAGWGIKEQKMLTVYSASTDEKYFGNVLLDGIFPSVPSSPVFPSGIVSVASKNNQERLFNIMKATTLLYGPGITGWDPVPVVMARLGLKDALKKVLDHFPERWQIYNNGWAHWGVEGEINKDAEWYFRTNKVRDTRSTSDKEKFPLPMWPFRHMSMESMSVFTTAMNESLLQSGEDIIIIAPAFHADRNGRFTLHAAGGFEVSSEIIAGKVQWICIKNLHGNRCRLQLPWVTAVGWSGNKKIKLKVKDGVAEITSRITEIIMIVPADTTIHGWNTVKEKPAANNAVRYHSSGKVQLGIPKQF